MLTNTNSSSTAAIVNITVAATVTNSDYSSGSNSDYSSAGNSVALTCRCDVLCMVVTACCGSKSEIE